MIQQYCQTFFIFLSLILLQACAGNARQTIAPVPVEDRSVTGDKGSAAEYPSSKTGPGTIKPGEQPFGIAGGLETHQQPVIVALLDNAQTQIDSGDNSGAAATLERALRLDSKNARLWYQLGLVRLKQKNWQQAINLAKKSNSLAAGDYQLQLANWKLIAKANSSAGDKTAARHAAEMARKIELHR